MGSGAMAGNQMEMGQSTSMMGTREEGMDVFHVADLVL